MPTAMNKRKWTVLLFLVALAGCYQDNEEALAPCVAGEVHYAQVVAVLQGYGCIGCHGTSGASGGVVLQQYSTLKTVADNGRLLGAISHAAGFAPMPQGAAKMSDCDIARIKAWIDAGALEH
ncbi:hypothetical protein SAMN05444008_10674 [Cnuella takakiae]|uniref:Cytochrome c domain-containing protein n=2 Tax=Cnuella takakiae TaxID=1302690 RepID=A0A1M5A1P1_9BACT|nr:hypothetical protein SAMN05444008_10674 [Cnuella takakiae]